MYDADFKLVAEKLRAATRAAAEPDRAAAWNAQVAQEGEMVLDAIEHVFDHLVQFEQATAAAHLAAWCIPALYLPHPRAQALMQRALRFAEAVETCSKEVERLRDGTGYSLAEWVARNPAMLQHRGGYWLRAVRLVNARVCIEYGCGAGPNILHLARLEPGRSWIGFDVSGKLVMEALAMADRLHDAGRCERNVAFYRTENPVAREVWTGKADTVAVLDVLEHTAHPNEVLSDAESFCKPGGLMVVTVPLGPWTLFSKLDMGEGLAGGHVNVASLQHFAGFISRRGKLLDLEVQPGPVASQPNASVCVTYVPGAAKAATLIIGT